MPSVIALDNSLSMAKLINNPEDGGLMSKLQLSCLCASTVVDYLSNSKLEHIALLSVSSNIELLVDFTRNYEEIKTNLNKASNCLKYLFIYFFKNRLVSLYKA